MTKIEFDLLKNSATPNTTGVVVNFSGFEFVDSSDCIETYKTCDGSNIYLTVEKLYGVYHYYTFKEMCDEENGFFTAAMYLGYSYEHIKHLSNLTLVTIPRGNA